MDEQNNRIIVIDDGEYKTQLPKKFQNRKSWTKPDPKRIVSVIPGTILKIFVKVNQKIKAGEALLTLEAMKMRNKVESPVDGTVKAIHVDENEKVAKGILLIEIE